MSLRELFKLMSASKQGIDPSFSFSMIDVTKLLRDIRLLIDDGLRTIGEASLVRRTSRLDLKVLELRQLMSDEHRDHT
jgi:putative ATP-dependent endonuclease of OLD family